MLCLAACGGGSGGSETVTVTETTPTTTPTTTGPAETTSFRVYFLRNGKVQPVERQVPKTKAVAGASLQALNKGLTDTEIQLGMSSAINVGSLGVTRIEHGNAVFDGPSQPTGARAQIVYTLTQFPTVKTVEIAGTRYTRADFEDETPAILVESPLPFQTVKSPVRATGTANTFEATFQYELTDPDGKILARNFVTATSGSGTRGTFDLTQPFSIDRSGVGELIVYELSAKDGSRINLVEVPIQLER